MITENDRNILALAQLVAEGAPPQFKDTYKASIKQASIFFSMRQRSENQETLENQRQALANQVQEPVPVPEEMQAAQEGGPIQNAETDLEAMLGPMGVINDNDGSPGPSLGGEGVADDLTMEVPEGSYILNSDAVSLIGISDINTVIRDAYTIAAALGQELPADYDPQNKVPIRISNGEAVIPAPLVGVIGLDRLERWNAKGLEVRRQREEAEKAQAETQAAQPVTEAPPVQPMQAQMSGMMGFKDGDEVKESPFIERFINNLLEQIGWTATSEFMDTIKKSEPEKLVQIIKEIPALNKGGKIQRFKDGTEDSIVSDVEDFLVSGAEEVKEQLETVWDKVKGVADKIGITELFESDEEVSTPTEDVPIPKFRPDDLKIPSRDVPIPTEDVRFPGTPPVDYYEYTPYFKGEIDTWIDDTLGKDFSLNFDNALILAETIAMQESENNPDSIQKTNNNTDGPGRGLFQFEIDHSNAEQIAKLRVKLDREPTDEEIKAATQDTAETAILRAKRFEKLTKVTLPWLAQFDDDDENEKYDITRLTGREQTQLFTIHHLLGEDPFLSTINNLTEDQAFEYWKNHHKTGDVTSGREKEFRKHFRDIQSKRTQN
jgi:hypothetical protein